MRTELKDPMLVDRETGLVVVGVVTIKGGSGNQMCWVEWQSRRSSDATTIDTEAVSIRMPTTAKPLRLSAADYNVRIAPGSSAPIRVLVSGGEDEPQLAVHCESEVLSARVGVARRPGIVPRWTVDVIVSVSRGQPTSRRFDSSVSIDLLSDRGLVEESISVPVEVGE
ncbi:MAG: hypothetical protein JNM10_20655 [Planctomycetia bacterium]|nr:hypothetical protein [Planctomycetia bacterium]